MRQLDLLGQLELILASLDPLTRAIFLAHRVNELPYARIADEAGISIAEVEKRMAKAIHRIAQRLDEADSQRGS
jgi:RNA polymerase sigma-70 factor (ECF subfamily)